MNLEFCFSSPAFCFFALSFFMLLPLWHFSKALFSYQKQLQLAMTSVTFMTSEPKVSTKLSMEAEGKSAVGVKAWVNNEQVFSLINFFLIPLFEFYRCQQKLSFQRKHSQTRSERATSFTTTSDVFRPLEMMRSKICPLLCVESVTSWESPKSSKMFRSSLALLFLGSSI